MARGDVTTFQEFRETIGDGTHDIDNDVWKIALITNGVVPTAATATPALGDFTQVTGTNYTAGGETVTVTWTESGGTINFAITSASWTQHASGPTNIYYAIVYNDTATTPADAAIAFIDMTDDGGTTPISLVDGDITINAGNVFTLS